MKKTKNYKFWSGFLPLLFLMLSVGMQAQSFLINFPAFSSSPTKNPQDITVCNGTSKLQVQMSAGASSTSGGEVTIQLAAGMEYVAGSATVVSTNAALTITENGGTANAPKFKIANIAGIIQNSNSIIFTIERKATCAARTEVTNGNILKDTVTGTISGSTTSTELSGSYDVKYAVLSFTQPGSLNNATVGQTATRTFSVTNGGNGAINAIHFSIEYVDAGIMQNNLTLTGGSGSTGTPVTLSPTSTVGNIRYYTIPGTNLSGGNLDNGEVLTFSENFTVKKCNPVTNYKIGWGCNAAPADWCETKTGIGSVTMTSGTPDLSVGTATKIGYIDSCTPFTTRFTFKNSGSGNATSGGMYNVKLRWGNGQTGILSGSGINRNYINFQSAAIGGQSGLTIVNGTIAGAIATLDVKDLFTTDPDGAGVGLEDLDGDGYYDDLPVGNTVTVDIMTKINCSTFTTCPQDWSNTYDTWNDLQYTTMCGSSQTSATRSFGNIFSSQVTNLINKSYAPVNVFDGTPFKASFGVGYFGLINSFDTSNTRYAYEITLPAGISLSGTGNIKWYPGIYPANSISGTAISYTQNGNVITLIPINTNQIGWVDMDLVYTCGTAQSPLNIPFVLRRIDNINTGCSTCNDKLFCGNLTIGKVVCPASCSNGGTSLTYIKTERADNSLGWTDTSLTTKQSRSNISDYDLSKALYLDDINVSANGIYGSLTNTSGFYLYFGINKLLGTDNKLTPKSIDVTIKRGGNTILTSNINTFTNTGTTTSKQIIRWDLSSLLSQLQQGDIIETISHYSVSSSSLPTHDMQTGENLYFYNIVNGSEVSCMSLIPELYLVGATYIDGNNSVSFSSCTSGSIGGGTHFLGYRFDTGGTKYQSEIRPGFLPKKLTFTLPNGFALNRVEWIGFDGSFPAAALTPVLVSGNTYTVDLTAKTMNMTVTNNYSAKIDVIATPTCSATASGVYTGILEYVPYYYHYVDNPSPTTTTSTKNIVMNYSTATKPSISLTNLTGSIQASKPIESSIVRITSTGTSTAPYVWLAIPTTSGVTINQVVDVATNIPLMLTNYPGGVWVKISDAGLASSTYKDYRIDFAYTVCSTASFSVNAGWNCAGYPVNPSISECPSAISTTFTPILGELQVQSISQPSSPLSGLCNPLDYVLRLNSAGGGNLKDVKFAITQISGVNVTTSTIQAEYPAGAGNWSAVSYTTSGNDILLDLTTHPAYPATGLPGTLNDGGNANNRMIGVRFSITTDCNFVSGSNFTVTPFAKNTCGTDTTGSGSIIATGSISVTGADPTYLVASTISVNPATVFDNCASPIMLPIEQTITSLNPTGSTGTTRINLPLGYEFNTTSGTFTCSSAFCPTFQGIYTDAVTGTQYMVLNIPAGMHSGDKLIYSVQIKNAATPISCGDHTISIKTFDKAGSISCPSAPGGVCSDVTVQTGKFDLNFSIKKPTYSIDELSGVLSGGTFAGSVKISNTSVYNSTNPISITFYCADAAGNPTSTVFGTATIATPVAAGANVTYTYSFTPAATCNSGKVYAVIKTTSNCVCTDSNGSILQLLCYKPAATTGGTAMDANHGITALGRAKTNTDNWPMARKGAWTVLESKEKGFVVNRVATTAALANITNPVIGMTVYDTEAKCLKIYSVKEGDTNANWHCFNMQTCPD